MNNLMELQMIVALSAALKDLKTASLDFNGESSPYINVNLSKEPWVNMLQSMVDLSKVLKYKSERFLKSEGPTDF